MSIRYRKNLNWTSVFVTIPTNKLDELGQIVEDKVREKLALKKNSRKWKALDIVDTVIVGSSYHQSQEQTVLELLVHVADVTGEVV